MSDLRTRITAAIYLHAVPTPPESVVEQVADAVIRELDLAAALCSEYFKGYNNGHDEGFIEGWKAATLSHQPGKGTPEVIPWKADDE